MVTDRVAYQLFQELVDADWKEDSPADNRGKTHPAGLIDEVRDLIRVPAEVGDDEVAWFLPDATFPDVLSADQRERLNSFRTVIAAGETYHAIALRQFRRNDSPLKMVYYEGPDTASHLFMQFRPPRLDGVEQAEVALFGGIVDRYYERQDRFIGEILEAVGEDADIVLVSDHGFKSDNNRPPHSDPRIGRGEAAEWHTPVGVLVLAGPDIRRGFDLGAASVLDITPTILALFGLPVGRDMDGQPLAEALTDEFLEQHPVEWIDSYGGYRETGGELAGGEALRSPDAEEHLEKLRSLGYIGTERSTGHNNRGLMALQEGDVDRAIAEFERALAGGDETAVMVRANLARAWLVKGDHDRALALVEQVLAEDPRNEEAEIIRAGVEVERGDLEAAAAHLRRAIAIDPTDVQAHSKLGEVYQRLGDSEAALVEFRKVVEIAPLNAIEHNNIGNIHRERGEIDLAIAAYRDAVGADPQYIGAYNNLGLCLQQQGRLREASELYEKALAIRPENPVLRNSLGTLRAGEGNREAAVAEFERAAAADPGWPVPQRNLARVLFEAGRFPEAKSAFERLLSSEPDSVEARLGYAMTLLMLQDRDRAIAEFDEVLRRDAGNLRARIALGETLLHQGDLDSARSHLERAVEIDATIPRLFNTLGEIYLRQDLRQDAARMFEKSLSIDPDQDSVRQRLAEARR
jgi:tetratricopeptide (TPR) repeat protein